MNDLNRTTTLLSLVALAAGCGGDDGVLESAPTLQADLRPAEEANILTIEHFVPHISTVPANTGASVQLSVRERVREQDGGSGAPDVVLFIHGNTFPGVPGADLRLQHYDWMLALAKAGFDAFTMDHSGYGFSPRPRMDDPCNVDPSQQASILIPNPLPATCPPSYPFRFATSQSEWDEIDRVVDYLRSMRSVERVNLIGWSERGMESCVVCSASSGEGRQAAALGPDLQSN